MTTPAAVGLTPPLTLRLATALAVVQTIGECIAIGWREDFKWPLRVALILVIGVQILFARWARRFSPGGVLCLFAYQIATIVVALATSAPLWLRFLLGGSALSTFALLAASLSAFPSPDIPISRGPR
ncbi:MAG: hypothetical protein ACR2LQ_14075 [Acidimicrobiales bacterium]